MCCLIYRYCIYIVNVLYGKFYANIPYYMQVWHINCKICHMCADIAYIVYTSQINCRYNIYCVICHIVCMYDINCVNIVEVFKIYRIHLSMCVVLLTIDIINYSDAPSHRAIHLFNIEYLFRRFLVSAFTRIHRIIHRKGEKIIIKGEIFAFISLFRLG